MTEHPYAVPAEVAAEVIRAADEGRAIQGSWRKPSPNGRGPELVCALAAFGPGINSASDCPAEYMPTWLAELIRTLDDGISAEDVPWFFRGLADRARRWSVMDAAAWDRVSQDFRIACIEQALEAAAAVQPSPKPAYWDNVHDACGMMVAALKTGDGAAARAAARAAWAAWAAWAVAGAGAAGAAAYKRLAETLFTLLDREIGQ